MALVEVKGTNRRVSGCQWRVQLRIDRYCQCNRYAVDGETDVSVLKGISGIFIFEHFPSGRFSWWFIRSSGELLDNESLSISELRLMILQQIRFHRDDNLSVLTRKDIVHKSKTMKAMVPIRRRTGRLHNVSTIGPSPATRLVLHYCNDGGLGLRRCSQAAAARA